MRPHKVSKYSNYWLAILGLIVGCGHHSVTQPTVPATPQKRVAGPWRTLTAKEDDYQVSMPGAPVRSPLLGEGHKYLLSLYNFEAIYTSICLPLPSNLSEPDEIREFLNTMVGRELAIQRVETPEIVRDLTFMGKPGLEVVFSALNRDGGYSIVTLRFFVVNAKEYELGVAYSHGRGSLQDQQRFFDSFHLLSEPGKSVAYAPQPAPEHDRVEDLSFALPVGWRREPSVTGVGYALKSDATHAMSVLNMPDVFLIRTYSMSEFSKGTTLEQALETYKETVQKVDFEQIQKIADYARHNASPELQKLHLDPTRDFHIDTSKTMVDSVPAYKFVSSTVALVEGHPVRMHSTQLAFAYKDHIYTVTASYEQGRSLLMNPIAETFLASLHLEGQPGK